MALKDSSTFEHNIKIPNLFKATKLKQNTIALLPETSPFSKNATFKKAPALLTSANKHFLSFLF